MMKFRALTLLIRQQKSLLTFKNKLQISKVHFLVWHNTE